MVQNTNKHFNFKLQNTDNFRKEGGNIDINRCNSVGGSMDINRCNSVKVHTWLLQDLAVP